MKTVPDRQTLSYCRPASLLFTGLLLSLLWANSLAQEVAEATPEPEARGEQQVVPANAPAAKSQSEKSTSRQATEVFRPSEEISEDLSVPFPVDI